MTMTHHPDAPSGQPYSPPPRHDPDRPGHWYDFPTTQDHLPPPVSNGGDGGGGRDDIAALRAYLTWLAGYAAIPGDSAFDRRLEMARESVDRLGALVSQAWEAGAAEERGRLAAELRSAVQRGCWVEHLWGLVHDWEAAS